MRHARFKLLIFSLFFLASVPTPASDLAKEQRWADQIVDALITGEAVWLPAGQHKILAIYTESEAEPARGGAILLHGIGVHPDWPDVIHPLRTRLPEAGWATLSVQMPVLPNEATGKEYLPLMDEVAPRIEAAIAFLRREGIDHIVIIAHSLGNAMAGYYLATHPGNPVRGYVGISMSEIDTPLPLSPVSQAKKIPIPVLDVYGSEDLDNVIQPASRRKQASGSQQYRQVVIEGANHFFHGKDDALVETVAGWLNRTLISKSE